MKLGLTGITELNPRHLASEWRSWEPSPSPVHLAPKPPLPNPLRHPDVGGHRHCSVELQMNPQDKEYAKVWTDCDGEHTEYRMVAGHLGFEAQARFCPVETSEVSCFQASFLATVSASY